MKRLVLVSLIGCWLLPTPRATGAQSTSSDGATVAQVERLSVDLRGRLLTEDERRSVALSLETDSEAAYEAHVDRWLTKDALETFLGTFIRAEMFFLGGDVTAEVLFHLFIDNGFASLYRTIGADPVDAGYEPGSEIDALLRT